MTQTTQVKGYKLRYALSSNDYKLNCERACHTVIANKIRNGEYDFLLLSIDAPNGVAVNYPGRPARKITDNVLVHDYIYDHFTTPRIIGFGGEHKLECLHPEYVINKDVRNKDVRMNYQEEHILNNINLTDDSLANSVMLSQRLSRPSDPVYEQTNFSWLDNELNDKLMWEHNSPPKMDDRYYARLSKHNIDNYDHLKNLRTGRIIGSNEVRFIAKMLKVDLDKNPEEFRRIVYETEMNETNIKINGRKYYSEYEIRAVTNRWWERIQPTLYYSNPKFEKTEQKRIQRALKRSERLLKQWLTKSEFEAVMNDELKIQSQINNTIYIVRKDPNRRVEVMENGKKIKELCVVVNDDVPTHDKLLTKILLLKTDEKQFLEIAHVWDRPSWIL